MKRLLSILICLAVLLSCAACKPDNITYPSEITDPNAAPPQQETSNEAQQGNTEEPKEEQTEPETSEEPSEEQTQPEEEQVQAEPPEEEQPKTEEETTESEPSEEEQSEPETVSTANPLASETFTASATTAGALPVGTLVKSAAASALSGRTITIYAAEDAFSYIGEDGKPVTELQWMQKLAEENNFVLKYQLKNKEVSVKSQRVALFSGSPLSLIRIAAEDLGNGLTLTRSAEEFLNLDATTYGVSKAVLTQSGNKLFAPVGNVDCLWYDAAALPENTDLQTMVREKKWTVEQFKTICANATATQKLEMKNLLPWTTLSGRSPLTLLEGKLDSNLYATVTRELWPALKAADFGALCAAPAEEAKPEPLFLYDSVPNAEKTLQYAPLPAAAEGSTGTVTFTGKFFALPKYETNADALQVALTFAELWCNRYTETLAGNLQKIGVKGADYQAYCDVAETQGMLILYTPEIQKAAEPYLAGLTDSAVGMDKAYEEVKEKINGLIAARNIYY